MELKESACDFYYVVHLITESQQLINQPVVIPSNWILGEKNTFYVKYPIASLESDFLRTLETMVEERAAPSAAWPKYPYRILATAYSYHEANMFLTAVFNGMSLVNSCAQEENNILSNNESIEEYETVAKLPKIEENDQSFEELRQEVQTCIQSNEAAINCFQKYKSSVDKLIALYEEKHADQSKQINELKALIMKNRQTGNQEKIMTFDNLMEKHNILTILEPDTQYSNNVPVFDDIELFMKFESHKHFMNNSAFVEDLKTYFYTVIDTNKPFKNEIRRILKIFFDKNLLHNNYTGFKRAGNKQIFKDTKFANALTDTLLRLYKGTTIVQQSSQGKLETAISENLIYSAYGDICTKCTDWGGGRLKRKKNQAVLPTNTI